MQTTAVRPRREGGFVNRTGDGPRASRTRRVDERDEAGH